MYSSIIEIIFIIYHQSLSSFFYLLMYQSSVAQAFACLLSSRASKTLLPHSFHHKVREEDDVKRIPYGEDHVEELYDMMIYPAFNFLLNCE